MRDRENFHWISGCGQYFHGNLGSNTLPGGPLKSLQTFFSDTKNIKHAADNSRLDLPIKNVSLVIVDFRVKGNLLIHVSFKVKDLISKYSELNKISLTVYYHYAQYNGTFL